MVLLSAVVLLLSLIYPKCLSAQIGNEILYPFELKDTLGRVVKAEQFKGKALVIDFWFTGCKGCVQVAEMLHKSVMPVFAPDSNVVFLSVSVDVNFLQWKRSLRSGLYSNNRQVNLFTAGRGTSDPLFEYYRFNGCPQMLVVGKKGNLVSMNVPAGADQLKELINKARI